MDWLIKKSNDAGLCFEEEKLKEIKPNCKGELRNSYTPLYWFWFPKWRKIYEKNDRKEFLDKSVLERYNGKYVPKNVKSAINKGIPIN